VQDANASTVHAETTANVELKDVAVPARLDKNADVLDALVGIIANVDRVLEDVAALARMENVDAHLVHVDQIVNVGKEVDVEKLVANAELIANVERIVLVHVVLLDVDGQVVLVEPIANVERIALAK